MFKKNTVPQRKPLSIPREDLIEDIGILRQCEDQQNKLFWCLDEKPPQENKFSQLEQFLKGTNNLEDISNTLTNLLEEINHLKEEIGKNINDVKNKASSINLEHEVNEHR
ncbi:uncharacterized protein LOC108903771 [Anoplophora glabripennis]|uniref:uncharacterized protein LOC108903771 n=1 Tax=Anoplophora glabripennis TaxID=217634 RepID=UPI000874B535|nr:uncharacterized protein LOC108903771 [Anoplophora glabripennis]